MENANKNILIVGGGLSGIHSCKKIMEQGFTATLIDQGEGFSMDPCYAREGSKYFEEALRILKQSPSITLLKDTRLIAAKGEVGSFEVTLIRGKEHIQKSFGAIVIALPYSYEPLFSQYNLAASDNIFSLTQTENNISLITKDKEVVVFLMDFERDSNPLSFKRIISLATDIVRAGGRSFVITRYVKVACPGMEKLVTEAKKQGVFIIKSPVSPLVKTEQGIKVVARDSILEKEVEIEADKIVVEERICPGLEATFLKEKLGLHSDALGFLQSNNVRRVPVFTNIKGVLASGTAIGIKPFYNIMTDGLNVALELLNIYKGKGGYEERIAIDVDIEKCARCLTCLRVCPHRAISWNGERIVISPLMCEGCGTCASECPMNAIELKEYSDGNIKQKLSNLLNKKPFPIIIFCCKNSALNAWEEALSRKDIAGGFCAVEVPCAGKVDVDYIMEALVKGAPGVIVAACHPGNCKAEKGTTFASYRINTIKSLLQEIGMNPEKVEFIPVASNEASRFATHIQDFAEKIS